MGIVKPTYTGTAEELHNNDTLMNELNRLDREIPYLRSLSKDEALEYLHDLQETIARCSIEMQNVLASLQEEPDGEE